MIVQINIKYQYNFCFVPLKTIPCISFRGSKLNKKGHFSKNIVPSY